MRVTGSKLSAREFAEIAGTSAPRVLRSLDTWQRRVFGGLVRLAVDDRREAVHELIDVEGRSQRQAARIIGVDETTVRRDIGSRAADAAPRRAQPAPPPPRRAANAAPTPDEIERRNLAELLTASTARTGARG